MNSVAISGRLTRDPEMKETASGLEITNFGVAVEQRVKDGEEWGTKAHFVDCTVFGGFARLVANKAVKGDLVSVSGRLDFSQWETDNGDKRSKLGVVVNEMDGEWKFRKAGEKPVSTQSDAPADDAGDDDIPF
jgi:single-strand DNA-binding protein